MKKRVHILSAVNAANVSKSGNTYTIKDVCGAVDDIVMNQKLYPADQLAAGIKSLEGKPAPAGHPKNAAGQHISALNGEALASAWIGSYCCNARHEGGRSLVDVVVNEAQARAHSAGVKLVERLDAAINGTNMEPIHVSTGLYHDTITANGESRGKKYSSIAVNYRYDHLAILVDGTGAGTPSDGVGLFLNEQGGTDEIETVEVNHDPEDQRSKGLLRKLLNRLTGNGSTDLSFDQITSALYALMPTDAWLRDVFDRYVIWCDKDGRCFKQDYSVGSDGSVAFISDPVAVERKVEYVTINSQEVDPVKDKILAALNAAGISAEGKDDVQMLDAYNALITKPVTDKLNAANANLVALELSANAAKDAELGALAAELATNSTLTVDDLKLLGLDRLKSIKTNAKAAPVVVGGGAGGKESEFKGYSINSINDEGAK